MSRLFIQALRIYKWPMPSRSFSILWAFISFASPCLADGVTLEDVQFAAAKTEELTRKELQETGIPGIAIAIV